MLLGVQAKPPRADFLKRLRAESGVRNSPPDPPDPGNPPDPGKMVSGAAVQTLPNHAQESQDDVSSQANSLKQVFCEVVQSSVKRPSERGGEKGSESIIYILSDNHLRDFACELTSS